jgi:hypothetical protein
MKSNSSFICWQYKVKLDRLKEDLQQLPFDINNISINDIKFSYESKEFTYKEIKDFIERYEWLGKISLYPSHIFTARYKEIICGVVIMDVPYSPTFNIERLISRGASASWAPHNLSSKLIMFSIKWMVSHTQFRQFSAYCDPEANELGTIYQACNFYYLGNKFGSKYKYITPEGNEVSDRYFRNRSVYKRLAIDNGIEWNMNWQDRSSIIFKNIPDDIELKLRELSNEYKKRSEKIEQPLKHKYIYVLGSNKGETKKLRKDFLNTHKIYPYPKIRGI